MKTLHCIVTGHRQDDYFLAWIEEQATALNLTGWARHLNEKEAEVIAQGDEDNCRELLTKLASGSTLTGMNTVQETWLDDYKKHTIFEIRG